VALKGAGETAEKLYQQLVQGGIEILYDDREESPGVKFADADLIGIPIRLTASKRSLESGGIELKLRESDEKAVIPTEEIVDRVRAEITALEDAVSALVVEIPFEGS
jgi:prolyl-tRNA synthetase